MVAAPFDRATAIWCRHLGAAMRMAVACTMVALSTLYAPHLIRYQVAYPAFSYATVVLLLVHEATLGDTLRGAWHALIGTSLVMGPSMACLWLIGPGRFTRCLAGLAVALGAFGLAITEPTPILAKRIAFGQTVLVYVGAVVLGKKTDMVMHPFQVAASTGVGAMSSILAMLIPFPRLANFEIKRSCKSYAENATLRLNLLMKAIADEESSEEANHLLSHQIKSLSEEASRLLPSIQHYQDAMVWERPQLRLSSTPGFKYPTERLQKVEITFEGLEMALASYLDQHPKEPLDQWLKDELQRKANQLRSTIEQIARPSPPPAIAPEVKEEDLVMEPGNLPILFMIQCINCLSEPQYDSHHGDKGIHRFRRMLSSLLPRTSKQNTVFALKCSLSLGLAVVLGLYYTKQNGYWSGLTIAISFVTSRQATFTSTNARAQGTALGSVYGVLGYFVSHNFGLLKLATLLPWIVFTTFLRHSKMYGEAGSLSAIIAALLILGRKDYGTPTEFATARLIESFIGLSCFIVVEILIQPQRAAILVKTRVSQSIRALDSLLEETVLRISQDKRKEINDLIDELDRLVQEAIAEPNFWFTPFPGDCYTRLVESIRRIARTVFFMAYSVEALCLVSLQRPEACFDIKLLKAEISSALESMEEAMCSNNSRGTVEKGLKSHGTEMGKPVPHLSRSRISEIDEEKAENILSSFLQHTRDLTECEQVIANAEIKKQMVLGMGSVAFCMRSLVTETVEIGEVVNEILG